MKQIIAAVRNSEELENAVKSDVGTIFHMAPNIVTLKEAVKKAHKENKKLFIHIDLAEGIGKDRYGIQYAKSCGADGIISTRINMIKLAKEERLITVQRFFIVDSHSIETTVESVKASKADMVEIMPGTLTKVIKRLKDRIDMPIVAGGLIEEMSEYYDAVAAGAAAVSTGKEEFWYDK